ncbi:PTS sugar transporter subunit IIA [Georgenia faecalis]|uniref:Ascorbate-specific PTS system EIIA component n=1 Tax=Georgenia faecalis TaxID=2483799 RepID=A0ABV9DC24_9MICO|nr:PTS sugar transporter subunit IIA [Georgenia faecalis]
MGHPLEDTLPSEAIVTGVSAADWQAAIRAAGDALVRSGATTDAYTDEMIATVENLGPYIVIAPGFALAHSRPSEAVLRTGLSWVQLATPVEFGSEKNDPVDLVVGLAARDHDSHLQTMAALATILSDADKLAVLRSTSDPEEVRRILTTS